MENKRRKEGWREGGRERPPSWRDGEGKTLEDTWVVRREGGTEGGRERGGIYLEGWRK